MFEARQEVQMQTQMQTMMVQMWHHLTSQAGIPQVQQHQEALQQTEADQVHDNQVELARETELKRKAQDLLDQAEEAAKKARFGADYAIEVRRAINILGARRAELNAGR